MDQENYVASNHWIVREGVSDKSTDCDDSDPEPFLVLLVGCTQHMYEGF